MSKGERKLADFKADCTTEFDTTSGNGFSQRRVILSTRRILLVSPQFTRTTIPLTAILRVGRSGASGRRKDTASASLLYRHDSTTSTAVLRTREKTVARFLTVLFRALLDSTPVRVKHPAKVGGKVVDSDWERATVRVRGGLTLKGVTRIELGTVEKATVEDRTVRGRTRPVLEVDHTTEHSVVTTQVCSPDSRLLDLLSDFIQAEYQRTLEEVNRIHLDEDETNVAVAVYSGITPDQLPDMLGKDHEDVEPILQNLRKKGIIRGSGGALALTGRGRIIASRNF